MPIFKMARQSKQPRNASLDDVLACDFVFAQMMGAGIGPEIEADLEKCAMFMSVFK